jgi:septum site-determining protein MinC
MNQPVVIKSSKYGINLILHPELEFEDLLEEIQKKFEESQRFFAEAELVISFEGRKLSEEEQCRIVDCITEHTSIRILCIVENDELRDELLLRKIQEHKNTEEHNTVPQINRTFYRGALASGEEIQTEDSIIIMGDVPEGSSVVSKSNIIVLGALHGSAFAGMSGNTDSFIAALDFMPEKYNIAGIYGNPLSNSNKRQGFLKRNKAPEAQIARAEGSFITVFPLQEGVDGII